MNSSGERDPGVVDEAVQRFDETGRVADLLLRRDVEQDLLGFLRGVTGAAHAGQDAPARLGERHRARPPDAGGGTGHENRFQRAPRNEDLCRGHIIAGGAPSIE
jgi:hypothetical protein